MEIKIDVENVFSRVTRSDERVDQILDKAFSYLVDGYRYMTPYKLGQWDGKKHLYTATRRLPSGLVPEATALLEKSDYDVVINDLRVRPDKGMKAWNLRGAEQREHQMEAIVAALEEGRGVIWHATGAGKCLVPETRVLTGDLRWVPVGTLKEGDTLVGFDEYGAWKTPRRMNPSKVLSTGVTQLPCYQLTFRSGETIICTSEHKWLVNDSRSEHRTKWRSAEELYKNRVHKSRKKPIKFPRYFKPWDVDDTGNGGYIRGLLDGEGSIRKRNEYGGSFNGVSFSQKNPTVLADAEAAFKEYYYIKRVASGDVFDLDFATQEGIKIIGRTRPRRLLEKWQSLRWPRLSCVEYEELVSIEPVGMREVITLTTSTKTFFAEGFGSHNTETMAAIIQMLNLKAVVMVNQTYIANQTRERFQQRLNKPVGIITGTKKIDGDIVCVTFQSLQSQFKQDQENQTTLLKKWLSKFDVMCLDEAHHSLARTYQQIINECPAYYRYGFSATPEKTQDKGARLHITGSTGPVLDRFTAGEGVEKGFLVKAHITFIKWHEDSPKDSWSKEDFEIDDRNFTYTGKKTYLDERTGKRLPLPTPELGLYDVGIVRNKVRNGVIIDSAAAMYDEGLTTLILVERIDHGLYLKKAIEKDIGAPVLFLQGANSQAERDEAKRRFASGSHRILIATTIFDEGVDIPVIDGLILAAAGKAQHRVIQRLGRGMRTKPGKECLEVVDLYDTHSRTLWRHAKERMKAYKSDADGYAVEIEEL